MTFSKTAKSFFLAAAVALLPAPWIDTSHAAPAPLVTGSCMPTKIKFALSTRETTTASNTPVQIADAAIRFTQVRVGCVIVDFTSSDGLDAPPPGTMFIRAVLKRSNGARIRARPFSARLNFPESGFEIRAIQFVFPRVSPGNYVLRMQLQSLGGGGVTVDSPNTVVHYN